VVAGAHGERDVGERLGRECGADMDKNIDAVVVDLCDMLQQYNKEGIELTATTNLGSELNIDSVEVMDLIMEIEDKFDIDIPINLVSDIERIGDLAKLVCQRMEGR
jgi:acyl carrier protein